MQTPTLRRISEPREVAAPRVRVNVTIDPALLRQADEFAEANGLTRSGLIEDALGARLREYLPGSTSLPMDGIVAARRSATADTRQTRLQEDVQGSEEHSVARAGRLREEVLVRPPSRILRKAGKRQKQGT